MSDPFKTFAPQDFEHQNKLLAAESTSWSGPSLPPALYTKLEEINYRAPWLSPETQLVLAQANASPETIDLAGQYASQRQVDSYDDRVDSIGETPGLIRWGYDSAGWLGRTVAQVYKAIIPTPARAAAWAVAEGAFVPVKYTAEQLKPVTRWGVAALDIIPETIQNVASMAAGQSSYDLGGLWASTSLATLLDNYEDQGSGYFMAEQLRQEQHRRARIFRGTVGASTFTVGRGAASTIFREGTEAYNYASGLIDGIVTVWSFDPTKLVTKGVKSVKAGIGAKKSGLEFMEGVKHGGSLRGSVPMLSQADAVKARLAYLEKAKAEAGLATSITGNSVNVEKFDRFWRTNPTAKELVDTIVKETKPSEIQDRIFKYKISNDMALRLARAKTEDEVISAMTYNWTYGSDALNADIGRYRVKRLPFTLGLRNSRFFTALPKRTIVVAGDERQSAEAVRDIVATMRTGGVPEEEVVKFLNGDPDYFGKGKGLVGAVEAFTQRSGSSVARHDSLVYFNEAMKKVLKANGISDPVIKETLYDIKDHIDRVKNYFVNTYGRRTDNGHLAMMMEHWKEYLPPEVYNKFLEGGGKLSTDLEFAQPMQIVDMLSRVQVLPDIRKIRRLTRNRLLARVFSDGEGGTLFAKMPITARREWRNISRVKDKVKWKEADDELQELLRKRHPVDDAARRLVDDRIDELDEIKEKLTVHSQEFVNTGIQRPLLAGIEWLQNEVWKPLNLATFGYFTRNAMDAQARMVFGGVNEPAHPIDYINLLLGRKYKADLKGNDITSLGVLAKKGDDMAEDVLDGKPWRTKKSDEVNPNRVHEELRDAFYTDAHRVGWTASDSYMHGVRSNSFPIVSRNSGPAKDPTAYHTDGIVQQGQKILSDPLQNLVARGLAQGDDDEKIIDDIVRYLKSNSRGDAMRDLDGIYKDGVNYWYDGRLFKGIPSDLRALRRGTKAQKAEFESLVRGHLRTVVLPNVKNYTGDSQDIIFMFAYDKIPLWDEAVTVKLEMLDAKPGKLVGTGDFVHHGESSGIVTKTWDAADGTPMAEFVPTDPGRAISRGTKSGDYGSKRARRIIERTDIRPAPGGKGLPSDVPREQMVWTTPNRRELPRAMDNWMVSWFFNGFNDVAVRKLEKSPTFRSFYYKTVGEHIDELSFEEGMKLYKEMLSKAEQEGKTIRQYLGERRYARNGIGAKIENLPNRTDVTGTLTVDELNDYARLMGISDTKALLYDASYRNNFGDAMRIIMPFANAWADVMGTWLHFLATDSVHMYRNFQRVYTGAVNADPDQDGRGFFFKDPQDGQLMFTFPLSGSITRLFTGVNAPLTAPLGRLSGGIGYYPALGPWAQLAATDLIPDTPDYNEIRQLLTPYGSKSLKETIISTVPGWVRKLQEASPILGGQDEESRTGVFAQTYIEALRILSVNTAKYDRRSEDDTLQLKADAKSLAAKLTIMRAISQFTGPTAATIDIKVPTEIGDVYVSELTKQLQKFTQDDYDSAIPKFIDLYGEELLLYTASKTKAMQNGLETSVEFDTWRRNNPDLLESYPRIGNYFAPRGSDFEFEVWSRQLQAGERVYLTDDELIESAQKRLGAVKYRAARQMFGAFPNEQQRQRLSDYREYLNQELPEFPKNVEFTVGETDNDIAELERILREKADDPRIADNPLTPTLKMYLEARSRAYELAGGKSLSSKKAAPYRAQLYAFGESLAFSNPEFDRIWERVLLQEVDQ